MNNAVSNQRRNGRSLARLVVAGAVVAGASVATGGLASAATTSSPWDELAQCESGGDWSANTGNGYSGGLQFSPQTWRAYGGTGSAAGASREEQIAVAERVLAGQGWGAWPSCSKKTGVSGYSGGGAKPKSSKSSAGDEKDEPKKSGPAKSDPTKKSTPEKKSAPEKKSGPKPSAAPGQGGYVVVPGDTLSEIATANRTSVSSLAAINGIADPDVIMVGQRLTLG